MIRPVEQWDKEEWYALDQHLPEALFDEKVRCGRVMFVLRVKRLSGYFDIIFSGTIHRFVQCYLLIPIIVIGVMEDS